MDTIIKINVANRIATIEGSPVIICNNSCYKAEFTFDSEWDEHSIKTARFVALSGKKTTTYNRVFRGSVVEVPPLSSADYVYVGVYAGDIQTTTPGRIACKKSILCDGVNPAEPDDDVYMQLIELFNGVTAGRPYVKYSFNSDGSSYTHEWMPGQEYMGVAVGIDEPTDPSSYEWIKFKGEPGNPGVYLGSGEMPAWAFVQIDPEGEIEEGGISNGSFSEGVNCVSGSKGFRITYHEVLGETDTYILSSKAEGYSLGDVVTVRIDEYFDLYGTIVEIDGNYLRVKPLDGMSNVPRGIVANPVNDQNTLRVPSKPLIGDVDVGIYATTFGSNNRASGPLSFSIGNSCFADGKYAFAGGSGVRSVFSSFGFGRFLEILAHHGAGFGYKNNLSGDASFVCGANNNVTGARAFACGNGCKVSGSRAFGGGEGATVTAQLAFGFGLNPKALGELSFVTGYQCEATAKAKRGFAGGYKCWVDASQGFAFGSLCGVRAGAECGSALGLGTIAASKNQTVVGSYNAIDTEGKYALIVGNGTSDNARSNAFAVTWTGNIVVNGVELTSDHITKLLALIK